MLSNLKIVQIFILALAFVKLTSPLPISSVVSQKTDFFSVSGTGKVTVVPDTAIVDLGINTSKKTVKEAQNEANTVITSISTALQDLGIAKKDIQTSNYSVYPQYDYTPGQINRVTGYQINANLTITVRDIDKTNTVIDQATSKGANTVGGIQLTVAEDKKKQLTQSARDIAVLEAKAKAESLAKAAGLTLGRVVNVQETSPADLPIPMMINKSVDNLGGRGGGVPTEIQPGSTDIISSVTLFYETR